MNVKVILTRGMQASGKSTWAAEFVSRNQDFKRSNRDSLRTMASNYTYDDLNEALVSRIEKDAIKDIIDSGYHVVIDNMHLSDATVSKTKAWITSYLAEKKGTVEFEVKEFPITLSEAIQRDQQRVNPLGASVLKNTWRRYEVELKQMLRRYAPQNESNKNGPSAVLVDIDGTLADSIDRMIFDNSKVLTDKLIHPVHSVVEALALSKQYKIIIMSGRTEDIRADTAQWLSNNKVPYHELFMRASKDFRSDTIVKKELYEQHVKSVYNVQFVIDDRPSVCKMWQDLGLFTFVVNQDAYAKNDF